MRTITFLAGYLLLVLNIWSDSYTRELTSPFTLIANQLDQGSNTLNEIMPVVPSGCMLYKYDNSSGHWTVSSYLASNHTWANGGNIMLNPGEGAFLYTPENFTLMFSGTPHVPVLPVTILNGRCYLLSRQTNGPGNYLNITGSSGAVGVRVYRWFGEAYNGYVLDPDDGWTGPLGIGDEPRAVVGESLWICRTAEAPPARPSVVIAADKTVECGGSWSFDPPVVQGPCGVSNMVTVLETVTNSVCPPVITRTWQTIDSCTNSYYLSQTVTVKPSLQIDLVGTTLTLRWPCGGMLQQADHLAGPWGDVSGGDVSPYQTQLNPTGTGKLFFRVRCN